MDNSTNMMFRNGLSETPNHGQPFPKLAVAGSPPNLPPCPNCGSVVQRMLSIPGSCMAWLTDDAFGADVDLVSCWQCRASWGLTYRGNLESGVEFLSWVPGRDGYPLWDGYPDAFQQFSIELFEQTPAERELNRYRLTFPGCLEIREETLKKGLLPENYRTPGYYLGGIPVLAQPLEQPVCPLCGDGLKLLATVPNHNGSVTGFFDYDGVVAVFQICLRCGVISSTHQTD